MTARRAVEIALRLAALALLALALVRATRPAAPAAPETASGSQLEGALVRWSLGAPPAAHAALDSAPAPSARDWLAALRRAGTPVGWSGERIATSAVEAVPEADPVGGVRVLVAAPPGSRVRIGDASGVVDSVELRGAGGGLALPAAVGPLSALADGSAARTLVRDSLSLRPVLVLGAAGWEAKFVLAALEERGWRVAARLAVAPGVEVAQEPGGAPGPGRAAPPVALDTARFSAVIVLDSTAAPYAERVARYVRQGGGAVVAGPAAGLTVIAGVLPGAPGRRRAGVAGALGGDTPRRGLALTPVARLSGGALALERSDAAVAVAARRVGPGRVVQVGYEDTWRWRMGGAGDAVAAHRAWWSRLVASVAYAGRSSSTLPASLDDAPRAHLVAALGAPSPAPAAAPARNERATDWLILWLLVVALGGEWASRRLRGAP